MEGAYFWQHRGFWESGNFLAHSEHKAGHNIYVEIYAIYEKCSTLRIKTLTSLNWFIKMPLQRQFAILVYLVLTQLCITEL